MGEVIGWHQFGRYETGSNINDGENLNIRARILLRIVGILKKVAITT